MNKKKWTVLATIFSFFACFVGASLYQMKKAQEAEDHVRYTIELLGLRSHN